MGEGMTESSMMVWPVGALCRAISDALESRFNPIAVKGEISGFSRAASGHCYFTLKDDAGQIRCAMFRRAALSIGFQPREGEVVQVRGRLGVYEARGDLQLIVESMEQGGQGALFEQFQRLKEKLQAQGLFDSDRKRELPLIPRGIGLVTSLGAAALHDIASTLKRRVPHIPVYLVAASVQGEAAPTEMIRALKKLYAWAEEGATEEHAAIDVILIARGGGSMEDLWSFNDEQFALTISQSPVPIVSGVGHETDFTICDFVADVRAPTPTAAAEILCEPASALLNLLEAMFDRLQGVVQSVLDRQEQRLDYALTRLGRPSELINRLKLRLLQQGRNLHQHASGCVSSERAVQPRMAQKLSGTVALSLQKKLHQTEQIGLRLRMLNPDRVLQRGYAWLSTQDGIGVVSTAQTHAGQHLKARLAQGELYLSVLKSDQSQ